MIEFGSLAPVRVVSVRQWVSKRERDKAAKEEREPEKSTALTVVSASSAEDDRSENPVDFFVVTENGAALPNPGDVINLRLAARGKGWETVRTVLPDGTFTEQRRNQGTAYSVRELLPAA